MRGQLRLWIPTETGSELRSAPLPARTASALRRAAHAVHQSTQSRGGSRVYVVLLERGRKHSLYVGRSSLKPENRFLRHKRGIQSSRAVRKWGVGLLPELYEHLGRAPREIAENLEADLAASLRSTGIEVTQS